MLLSCFKNQSIHVTRELIRFRNNLNVSYRPTADTRHKKTAPEGAACDYLL